MKLSVLFRGVALATVVAAMLLAGRIAAGSGRRNESGQKA